MSAQVFTKEKVAVDKKMSEEIKPNQGPINKKVADSTEYKKEPSTILWWLTFSILTSLSLITRLYKIEVPDNVCWDETHFGKMASWYINRTFFFDVHPPAGKMLIMLSGVMTNYNGSFPFSKPGDHYEDPTQYVGMRVFCALHGAALVPLAYSIVSILTRSILAAAIGALLIILDHGTLTLTRYILLDPLLICYIMLATFCLVKFLAQKHRPFDYIWWHWLSLTGVSLALAIGVKFVGLFVILLAGYTTVLDLWGIWGDLSIRISQIFKHFLARVLCLIVLPVLLYAAFFAIHFQLLNKSGSGDGFYSAAFQSQLKGNRLYNASMPDVIAYGSSISLKQVRVGGGYLHSHWHLYPKEFGIRQQQVTTYTHKDENNMWMIKQFDRTPTLDDPVEYVRHGDLVRLEHITTKRNLHGHKEAAPLTKTHYQITGYGENGTGDANDVFRLLIEGGEQRDVVKAVTNKIKLVHMNVGCALHSHQKQLPKWGWEQLEVTCNPSVWQATNLWHIEEVIDPRLPNVSFAVHAPNFVERFLESHMVMKQGNEGLKPKEGEVLSKPWQWIINFRGQPFSGGEHRVYLLGNPAIFWGNILAIIILCILYSYHVIRRKRGRIDVYPYHEYKEKMFGACWWLMLGWGIHYIPFWTMTRVLYFHHYFPALMYNCMVTGIVLDLLFTIIKRNLPKKLSWVIYHTAVASLLAGLVYSFVIFAPLSYGMQGDPGKQNSTLADYRWLESWDI